MVTAVVWAALCAVNVAFAVATWPVHPVTAGVIVFLGLGSILFAIGSHS